MLPDESRFISVIIPTYNHRNSLGTLLDSLCRQTYPVNKFEIIIVDDGSTDGTRELVKIKRDNFLGDLKYFYQQNKGPAAARNLGINNSKSEIVIFTDSDCIASEQWLTELVKGYDDNVAGIGGSIIGAPLDSMVSRYCAYIKMNSRPEIKEGKISYIITGNASFRRDLLCLIGGFDERFSFPGGEDPDICHRLIKRGYKFVYNPEAVVFNSHKRNIRELLVTYFNYGRGQSFLALKNGSEWDLHKVNGLKRYLCCFKILLRFGLMLLQDLEVVFYLLLVPLNVLAYYGQKGLPVDDCVAYSVFDFLKITSFRQGCIAGYLNGKLLGLNKKDELFS